MKFPELYIKKCIFNIFLIETGRQKILLGTKDYVQCVNHILIKILMSKYVLKHIKRTFEIRNCYSLIPTCTTVTLF